MKYKKKHTMNGHAPKHQNQQEITDNEKLWFKIDIYLLLITAVLATIGKILHWKFAPVFTGTATLITAVFLLNTFDPPKFMRK